MAIVKMKKLALIGLSNIREPLLKELMDYGTCEIKDITSNLTEVEWLNNTTKEDNSEKISKIEGDISRADSALLVIERYGKLKSPLFTERRPVSKKELQKMSLELESYSTFTDKLISLSEIIQKDNEKLNRLEQDKAFLSHFIALDVPLELVETKNTLIKYGIIQNSNDFEKLKEEFSKLPCEVEVISKEKAGIYVAVILNKDNDTNDILKRNNFQQISFKGYTGTVTDNINRIDIEYTDISSEISKIKGEIEVLAREKDKIENYYDILSIALQREKVKDNLLNTKETFFIEGWLPERREADIRTVLDKYGCYYKLEAPDENDEVPVLLDNPSFFTPVEAVTEMYSLPAYSGFDPTSIYGLFYILFFGMMFSDAGYGLILALGCFIVLKKFKLEGTTYKMIKLFMYSGVSTLICGLLFGSFFGNVVDVVSSTFFGKLVQFKALWFNPLENPMLLLGVSLVLGVIHLFFGMGIQAYMQIREGKIFDAICDEGFWYITITGLMFWLGGGIINVPALSPIGMWMSIIGAAGLLLTGGRHKKGFGKVTGGLSNIYNITSWLSDILSYARILALGLATGVIGQVVNTMGSIFGGGVVGLILFLMVFIVGHLVNFAINALGSFIHAARLQYVEFFGKFYIDGGEPFNPYRIKTKYIRITEE